MAQPTTLTIAGLSPRRSSATRRTIAYFAAFVALGLTTASLGPTLPALARLTGASVGAISFVLAARSLGFLAGSLIGGRLYDKLSGHRVMALMLILSATMMAVVPVVAVVWALVVVMFVLGTAESALDVGGNTLLVWTHGKRVGPFMNGLHFFFGVGATVSPIIVAQAVLLSGDVGLSYWILALVLLPVAACIWRVPSPVSQATSKAESASPVDPKPLVLIALFFFLYLGAELSVGNWVYSYAASFNMSRTASAYLTSAFWASLMMGRLLAIPVAVRFKPEKILLADLSGCLASVAVFLLWPAATAGIWIATIGIGFSMASIFPSTLTFAERRIRITGRVTGWFLVAASAGGATIPWMIGQAFESFGPRILIYGLLVDLAIALLVLVVLIFHSTRATIAISK